ncbi:GPI transamidase subunit PIG-U [Globomyces pollinis-pini]|nr:GPI transamidase subunit PIG-U [Globomyces pollinis-pini]
MNTVQKQIKNEDKLGIMRIPLWIGIAIRLVLIYGFPVLRDLLDGRIEITTPVTSFKRLREGLYLFNHGLQPYEGGVYHQAPLLLLIFSLIPEYITPIIFVLADWVVAKCLIAIAEFKIHLQESEVWPELTVADKKDKSTWVVETDDAEEAACLPVVERRDFVDPNLDETLLQTESTKPVDALIVPADYGPIYLLNPFSIAACIAQSTQVFSTLGSALALYFAYKGHRRASMFTLSIATYLSLYPIVFIAPCILFLEHANKIGMKRTIYKSFAGLLFYTSGFLYLSYLLIGDWSFIEATYSVIIFVNDLRPNVGLFWYFNMEVFEQFRTFFITVFHLNTFIFIIPISLRFKNDPLFVAGIIGSFVSLFKSYPSIADVPLYLSLLMMQVNLFKYSHYMYLVASGFAYCSVLGPLFFNSWVYAGSGNANFFYAITLVWAVTQIMLMVDLIFAHIRREWDRVNPGWRRTRVQLIYLYE